MGRVIADDTWAVLTIYGEARGESPAGQLAVAEVIRNRVVSRYQSDGTIIGTVFRPYQFSAWDTQDPNRRFVALVDDHDPAFLACEVAWKTAATGTDTVQGAVLYLNTKILQRVPAWVATCRKVATVGHHDFYVPI